MNTVLGIMLFVLAVARLALFIKRLDTATDKELTSVVLGAAVALTVLIWSGVILVRL